MNKPIFLKPSGKDYLWGGQRLNTEFNKNIDMDPLAETWECSTHPDGPSFVHGGEFDGQSLIDVIKQHPEYLGAKHKGENSLPILIKFIDAKQDLSVQVHPDDEYAGAQENGQLGKSEMWYVLDASPDAKLVYGFNRDVDETTVRNSLDSGKIMDYLQWVPVNKGDYFFIQSGRVHAIGAGCLIAEIQENSNLTYRLFDYNRVGKDGKKRELHVDKAMKVADFKASKIDNDRTLNENDSFEFSCKYENAFCDSNDQPCVTRELLSSCKYFEVYRMVVNTKNIDNQDFVHYRAGDSGFRVLLCIEGSGTISYDSENLQFKKGDCIFIPADSVDIRIQGQANFLDVIG